MITNSTPKNKDCKGCKLYRTCKIPNNFTVNNTLYTCPCQSCLVKGICNADCKEYITYTHKHLYYKNIYITNKDL